MAKRGRKPREFTQQEKLLVKFMSAAGMPQDNIAKAVKTDKKTLEKHFRDELDLAADHLNSQIVGALYKNAIEGNVTAQIFWLKTRLKWTETVSIDHEGITPVFNITVNKIDEE